MNDRRIELDLLTIFEAVMLERSVTRAAARLGMTQPAVSNALRRLRVALGDELFVKVLGGVAPTARAQAIWDGLREPLRAIRDLTVPAGFRPDETQSVFRMAVTDSLAARAVPAIAARFAAEAPRARLHFLPHTNPASTAALERGELDCAVGMFPNPPTTLQVAGLFSDRYVCVFARQGAALRPTLSLEGFVSGRHILVKQAIGEIGIVDSWLSLRGLRRDIGLIVNACADAIAIAARSGMLASVPHGFVASSPQRDDVVIAALPFDSEKILYKLAWSASGGRDPRDLWFRALVSTAVRSVTEGHGD